MNVEPNGQLKNGERMSEIDPGDGFRLIDKEKDTPKLGDQFHNGKAWFDRPSPLTPFSSFDTYRRRIPAKPEAMDIWNAFKVQCGYAADHFAIWQVGPPDSAGDVVVGNADEARQLADWLTRFADWREAQESK